MPCTFIGVGSFFEVGGGGGGGGWNQNKIFGSPAQSRKADERGGGGGCQI